MTTVVDLEKMWQVANRLLPVVAEAFASANKASYDAGRGYDAGFVDPGKTNSLGDERSGADALALTTSPLYPPLAELRSQLQGVLADNATNVRAVCTALNGVINDYQDHDNDLRDGLHKYVGNVEGNDTKDADYQQTDADKMPGEVTDPTRVRTDTPPDAGQLDEDRKPVAVPGGGHY